MKFQVHFIVNGDLIAVHQREVPALNDDRFHRHLREIWDAEVKLARDSVRVVFEDSPEFLLTIPALMW